MSTLEESGAAPSQAPWPEAWRQSLADPSWRARLARAVEERDEPALRELCECWIGLECHARLDTGSKLFCALPEGAAGWVDVGMPGALPTLDPRAAMLAARLGRALGATLAARMGFERKRYPYPDLAKGYQTTQKALCVWEGGAARWPGGSMPLLRAQIEEDAAKVKREGDGFEMDFARAGSPLLEIVSDAREMWPDEARDAARAVWAESVHCGASQGLIEEGHFKSDVNVSLRPRGAPGLGRRVEVKGVGSFDFARAAAREALWALAGELLAPAPRVERTWAFDEARARCVPMREKGDESAYKFLPDGDLVLRAAPDPGPVVGWFDARARLVGAFGGEEQTSALWEDPRRTRLGAELSDDLLGELAARGSEFSGPLARGFFAKAARPESPSADLAAAWSWACRAALAGARSGTAMAAAAEGLAGGPFDDGRAQSALGGRAPSGSDAFEPRLAAALEADPKARAAWEQARQGKPKALGYLFGALGSRLREAGAAFDPKDLSDWLKAKSEEAR